MDEKIINDFVRVKLKVNELEGAVKCQADKLEELKRKINELNNLINNKN